MTEMKVLKGLRDTSVFLTFFNLAFAVVMLVCFLVTSMLVMFTNLGVNPQTPDFLACTTLLFGGFAMLTGMMWCGFGVWFDIKSEKQAKNSENPAKK